MVSFWFHFRPTCPLYGRDKQNWNSFDVSTRSYPLPKSDIGARFYGACKIDEWTAQSEGFLPNPAGPGRLV